MFYSPHRPSSGMLSINTRAQSRMNSVEELRPTTATSMHKSIPKPGKLVVTIINSTICESIPKRLQQLHHNRDFISLKIQVDFVCNALVKTS